MAWLRFFGWNDAQVKERIRKFEAEPPTLRVQRYNEAVNYITTVRKATEPLFSIETNEKAAA
jgi:hypothetical protein